MRDTSEQYIHTEILNMTVAGPTQSTSQSTALYHVPVFVNESLPNGEHTVQIRNNGHSSVALFDYINHHVKTTPLVRVTENHQHPRLRRRPPHLAQSTTTSARAPVGRVVGSSIGGICAFLIVLGILFWLRRTNQRRFPAVSARSLLLWHARRRDGTDATDRSEVVASWCSRPSSIPVSFTDGTGSLQFTRPPSRALPTPLQT
ncbi:hypothetical protein BD413DRAFT_250827 [Trametes elegans]|nr:hypothetical protein BD413DRAFT_250827 [Trametes elegans]